MKLQQARNVSDLFIAECLCPAAVTQNILNLSFRYNNIECENIKNIDIDMYVNIEFYDFFRVTLIFACGQPKSNESFLTHS